MYVLERFAQIPVVVQITSTRIRNRDPALNLLTKDLRNYRDGNRFPGFKISTYEIDYATAACRLCFPGNGAIEAVFTQATTQRV